MTGMPSGVLRNVQGVLDGEEVANSKTIVLITDGKPTDREQALAAADAAKVRTSWPHRGSSLLRSCCLARVPASAQLPSLASFPPAGPGSENGCGRRRRDRLRHAQGALLWPLLHLWCVGGGFLLVFSLAAACTSPPTHPHLLRPPPPPPPANYNLDSSQLLLLADLASEGVCRELD